MHRSRVGWFNVDYSDLSSRLESDHLEAEKVDFPLFGEMNSHAAEVSNSQDHHFCGFDQGGGNLPFFQPEFANRIRSDH